MILLFEFYFIALGFVIFRSLEGSHEIALDSSLLLKLLLEHHNAENEQEDRHGIEAAELYTLHNVKYHKHNNAGMIYRCCEYYTAKACPAILLGELADEVRALDEAVILCRTTDHFTLDLDTVALCLKMYARSALIFVKLNSVVDKLGVTDDREELLARY